MVPQSKTGVLSRQLGHCRGYLGWLGLRMRLRKRSRPRGWLWPSFRLPLWGYVARSSTRAMASMWRGVLPQQAPMMPTPFSAHQRA